MRVSYNKLWKLLIDKKMSKADLRKAVDIAPNTLTKMRKDGEVSMSVLLKIATYLDCDISDICEFVKDEESTQLDKVTEKYIVGCALQNSDCRDRTIMSYIWKNIAR